MHLALLDLVSTILHLLSIVNFPLQDAQFLELVFEILLLLLKPLQWLSLSNINKNVPLHHLQI